MMPLWLNSSYLSSIAPQFANQIANHLWQSTGFALAAWIATLLLRRNAARVRFAIWLAASLKFLLPFSLLIALGGLLPKPQRIVVAAPVATAVDIVVLPFSDTVTEVAPIAPRPTLAARIAQTLPAVLALLWLAGVFTVLAVWLLRWRQFAQTLRRAELVEAGREHELLRRIEARTHTRTPVPLLLSRDLLEPGLFGVLRPILLWPEQLSARLDDQHIEAILAHEVIHARRRDNLTAALHMLVEAVFWFHPMVWWLERRLIEERERACDEAVVALGSAPGLYADSLLKACRFCVESPLACVSGITGADLNRRVRSIMTLRLARLTLPRKLLLAAAALLAIAAPIMLGQVNAAQRMMLAAVNGAPMPFGRAAHAMIALEQTPSTGLIAEVQPPSGKDATLPTATDATPAPSFDVATIKPNDPSKHPGATSWSQGSQDELKIMGSLKTFLKLAYGIEDVQIAGGPKWLDSDLFEIDAKYSSPASVAQVKLMFRALLEQRFKLSTHTETKPLPVYSLVVAKGGPKLQQADASASRGSGSGPTLVRGTLGTAQLAHMLTPVLGRTVIDNTGLNGVYKVDLTWAADDQPSGPSLFTAIQEQLGLKLEPTKGPVETLVIDHAEQPSLDGAELPNPPTAILAPVSFAQQTPAPPAPSIKFDVVSIRQNKTLDSFPGPMFPRNGDGFYGRNLTLQWVLWYAYGFGSDHNPDNFSGLPGWVQSDRWDIIAKVSESDLPAFRQLDEAGRQRMLRDLLADRFKLQAHAETQEQSIYALVVAKGGPKLTSVDPPANDRAGFMEPHAAGVKVGHHVGMGTFALYLSNLGLDRPVQDQTGLTGHYDFTLAYSPMQPGSSASPNEAAAPSDAGHPFIFTAIQEQLGLKLEPAKGKVQRIVIDHIDRPSEN